MYNCTAPFIVVYPKRKKLIKCTKKMLNNERLLKLQAFKFT